MVGGRIVGIDESAEMVERARRRNAEHVASGRAEIRAGALADLDRAGVLADLDPAGERFDKVFAVNLDLFHRGTPAPELAIVARLLKPGGRLCLCYEPLTPERAAELAERLPPLLSRSGFSASTTTSTTTTSRGSLLGVIAYARDGRT
ncbi:class I SAM-dependent methyltransferase [Plantactinospora sp. B24E8]|uniref:SAM-dependent methyltransferase n=1 Tax=Plantactinospora sp. B24E8 TaxID=3153567 RepID=UPI00325F232F